LQADTLCSRQQHPFTTNLNVLAGACDTGQAADAAAADCCCNLLACQADGADHSGQLSVNVALALLLRMGTEK
jgi:hypothetical protein